MRIENTINPDNPQKKKERTADYLAPGEVLMDKGIYDDPREMRDFFQKYVESIRQEGIKEDPEKFARGMINGFLDDYEYGIKQWRNVLSEKNLKADNKLPKKIN